MQVNSSILSSQRNLPELQERALQVSYSFMIQKN